MSTPLPNISPTQAAQSSTFIKNPLLQTLFKSNNFQQQKQESRLRLGNAFSNLGLQQQQQHQQQQQQQQPEQDRNRENLVLQARERELIEKTRQIELLLNENNEKERLLLEALREQGKDVSTTSSVVPTFIPSTTTTPAPTTTTTPASTTTFAEFEEEFRNSDNHDVEEESLDDDEFEVEIILQMTRELVEARQKELLQQSEDDEEASQVLTTASTPFQAIMNARQAVIKTMEEGNDRTSPAVWAAVKILADFVDSQDPGLPSDVLQAIIQLTEFLNTEMKTQDTSDKIVSSTSSRPTLPLPTTSTTIKPTTSSSSQTLSPTQLKLREEILKQKLLKQKQINKILASSKNSDEKTKQQPSIKISTSSSKSFPSRINLMDVKVRGNQFSFSTLPIY